MIFESTLQSSEGSDSVGGREGREGGEGGEGWRRWWEGSGTILILGAPATCLKC